MKRALVISLLVLFNVLSCTTLKQQQEMEQTEEKLVFELSADTNIVAEQHKETDEYRLQQFILEGKTGIDWIECVEIITYNRETIKVGASDFFYTLLGIAAKKDQAVKFELVQKDNDRIIWLENATLAEKFPKQYSVSQILYGNDSIFLIIFTRISGTLDYEHANKWISYCRGATVNYMRQNPVN